MTAFNPFKKSEPKKAKPQKKKTEAVSIPEQSEEKATQAPVMTVSGQSALKYFYISEKASRLLNINQYVFVVAGNATKNEITKQVEKMFHVKVTGVNVLNMPKKARTVGRYSGFKSGFRKAIVTLAEGSSIAQAKP